MGQAETNARPARPHLKYLDGWRGVAVLTLLAGHFFPISPINMGRVGVELFFVLSGRLMAQILFIERTPLPVFYKRRLSRIYPALAVFCGVALLAGLAPPADIAAGLTFTLNYVRSAAGEPSTAIDHIWSLCVEEHAYLLLSVIAFVARRRPVPVVALLLALSLAAVANGAVQSLLLHRGYYEVFWRTDVRIASVLMAAALYLHAKERPNPTGWLPVMLVAAGLILQLRPVPDAVKYSLGTFLLAAGVATIQHAPTWVLRCLSFRFVTLAGVLSYSLYLWQQPFHWMALEYPRLVDLALLTAAVCVGLVSFYGVERPAREWLNGVRWRGRDKAGRDVKGPVPGRQRRVDVVPVSETV